MWIRKDEAVKRQGVDLVMLPTHGRGLVRRFLLGSVTAKILHDVSAAVWTGIGSLFEGHMPAIPYASVLCAVDDSDEAPAVLKAAAALADSYRARLWIVHVFESPPANPEAGFSCAEHLSAEPAIARLRQNYRLQ